MALFQINQFRGWKASDCDREESKRTGCYRTGGEYLRDNSIEPDHVSLDLAILLAFLAFFAAVSYIGYARVLARH